MDQYNDAAERCVHRYGRGTGKQYYTGYEYATLYDWDQFFETIIQLYLGWETTYARNGVEIFLDIQKENGYIQRSSKGCEEQLSEHVKPFQAQISLLCCHSNTR